MLQLNVNGVQVTFPFTPYPCQVTYMEKVIECLQKNINGILESPTGTGKTLCLLCSSLAWQESRKAQVEFNRQAGAAALLSEAGKTTPQDSTFAALAVSLQKSAGASWGSNEFIVPKIIYASRTHSQLNQAVQELKRTAYNSTKTAIIGSREQLCVHEQVKKEQSNSAKVHLCRAKVAAKRCHYYNVLEDMKRNNEPRHIFGNVVDIEDLVSQGTKNKVCPYYLARELRSDADIIFMPYNYLLDPKSRKAHGVELQGNIILFDEAHNLERICEESSSFDLTSLDLATAIEETTQLGVKFTELATVEAENTEIGDVAVLPEFTLEDIIKLKKTLLELEDLIDSEVLPDKGATKPGMFMFELLSKVNITFETKNLVIDILDKMVTFLNNDGSSSLLHSKGAGLSKVADVLKIVFNQEPGEGTSLSRHKESLAQYYKVHIHLKEGASHKKKKLDSWASAGGNEKTERVLSYWCFSPGYSMRDLLNQGVKAIILTSGTLAPIDSFTMEMYIPFPVRLENPHVIQKHQVWIGTLSCGPDGSTLNSNYQNRFTEKYMSSLGNCIVNFSRLIPNGMLVFFPSYPVMEKCAENWQANNIWQRILAYKTVIMEPRGKDAFTQAIDDFYVKINDETANGAIFMAVCRGKVSEGLDFADINGRAVIITGLPFPPMMDPRVILKMEHLDSLQGKLGYQTLTGQQWYQQQATRAVNQAIGRVIRHKDDFGAIMLCDVRFAAEKFVSQMPAWVRPYITKYNNFGQAIKDMTAFFKIAEKLLPSPQIKKYNGQKKSSGYGCHGAFFEPTASRKALSAEPASTVVCHVPGFSRSSISDEQSNASLKLQYNRMSGTASKTLGCRRGLLDALESTEKQMDPIQTVSENQSATYHPSVKIHPRKRKIVIKPHGFELTPSQATTTSNSIQPSVGSNTHLNLAESYISEVKAVLSPSDYKRFSVILHHYKKSESLTTVTPVLADLFTSHPDHHHLFRKFYRFVRPQHKAEFDHLSLSLTGQSCGYRPEDGFSRKHMGKKDNQDAQDKRPKLDATCRDIGISQLSSSNTSKLSIAINAPTSREDSENHISSFFNKGNKNLSSLPDKVVRCPVKTDGSIESGLPGFSFLAHSELAAISNYQEHTNSVVKVATAALVDQNAGVKVQGSLKPQENDNSVSCRDNLSGRNDSGRKTSSQSSIKNDNSKNSGIHLKKVSPEKTIDITKLDIDKLHQVGNEINRIFPKSGYICSRCNKDAHVPFENECGHICCFVCWRHVLQSDKQCPGGCGRQVKRRHMRQLLFASGPGAQDI